MTIKVIKIVLMIVGVFLIIDSAVLLFSGFNFSKLFSALFGCGLIFVSLLDTLLLKLHTSVPSVILRVVFLLFLLSFAIIEVFLISSANHKTEKGDAVIVLGAGLIGRNPNGLLIQRLDTAAAFLTNNPHAVCVVSGGQGSDELISEAQAMRDYLVRNGIAGSRILMEDKSTSTDENFAFSKKVLNEYFGDTNYTCVYTTNSFHSFRAGLIAKKNGVITTPDSAPTLWYTRNNYYIREYFAMLKYLLLGK